MVTRIFAETCIPPPPDSVILRMRRYIFIIFLLALLADRGFATTIQINLGPPAIYTDANLGPIPFSDLNGTLVNGSSLSINFSFSGHEFVRLFSNTTPLFEVGVTLNTNAGTSPGFVTDPSGYLIDQNGNAIPNAGVTGTAQSSNGTTSVGLFPLLLDSSGTPNPALTFPLDFYGVHFSFNLPNDRSVTVVGANFTLFGRGSGSQFAVEPLPDSGSAFLLFSIATGMLLAGRTFVSVRHAKRPARNAR
jgi:hypothetical protein